MYFAEAHNFTNVIKKVAKYDEKQWTLIRLHHHTARMAD
jgi:hypothetical protein